MNCKILALELAIVFLHVHCRFLGMHDSLVNDEHRRIGHRNEGNGMEEEFLVSMLDISLCIGALETLNCTWWFIFFPSKNKKLTCPTGLFSLIRVILVLYEYQVW